MSMSQQSKVTGILVSLILFQPLMSQTTGGDLLNEAPLAPIPKEMTFEEYQDMNRRLTVGLVLAAIPVPGMIHFYAGEKKTGIKILGVATLGLGSILLGVSGLEEGDFPKSDYELMILNPGNKDSERQFEKVPVFLTNTDTTFKLHEIFREQKGGSGALILLGAALLIGDYVYDFIHGVRVIERKRDRVRYKYGQTLSLELEPTINLNNRSVGLKLSYNF